MNKTIFSLLLLAGTIAGQTFKPDIPLAWDDKEVAAFVVPLTPRDRTPRFLTSKEYYALKVRPIYRTYPVYLPGREPAGYMASLLRKDPEIVFDASKLRTKADWIRAGAMVFNSPAFPTPLTQVGDAQGAVGSPIDALTIPIPKPALDAMLLAIPGPTTSEGIVPYLNYVVRKRGVVELDFFTSCGSCHTRVLPNGTVVKGAQGNAPAEQYFAWFNKWLVGLDPKAATAIMDLEWLTVGAPWAMTREQFDKVMTIDELYRRNSAMQPGVFERHGTSSSDPSKIPSLIGVKDIKFLDSTGFMRHRSIGDLMRYAISNYGLDIMAHYGDFQPSPVETGFADDGTRFSDQQLYALALYLESLQPPPNPNRFDDQARRGQRIFQEQGCIGCHTPPLYTNNKLNPVAGFHVPEELRKSGDVMNVSVGTDPALALQTRRGTGFYKVPSLRGVWFRNAFDHNGQAETLEEWLDPARLRDDYVPKGFHLAAGAIKGHPFGLKLSPEDKKALIAFLKTL